MLNFFYVASLWLAVANNYQAVYDVNVSRVMFEIFQFELKSVLVLCKC